jgi:uncharacterized membrane protein YhdT
VNHPTKTKRRIFFMVGCLIVMAGNWPVLALANRIQPTILGFPFMFVYVGTFVPVVFLFLYVAYRQGV